MQSGFGGGKINISYNCLDRHLTTARRNKAALIWKANPATNERSLTNNSIPEVCKICKRVAQERRRAGRSRRAVSSLIPELANCDARLPRLGATHSVIFGGFSSNALVDRINDASCKVVVTADGGLAARY